MDPLILLDVILKHLQEGILVVNQDAVITYINEPSAHITGLNVEGCIGKNILEVFPDLSPDTSTFYRVLRSGRSLLEHIQAYKNSQGHIQTIVTSTIPLFQNYELIGAIEIYRSIDNVQRLMDKITVLQNELNTLYKHQKDYRNNGTMFSVDQLIGVSESTNQLKQSIEKIADSSVPVLIFGETGTGKEVVVQSIHNASMKRRTKPFLAQNCAAIPPALLESIMFGTVSGSFTGAKDTPGLFEQADGGTLFLDEINSMDLGLQAKLLRVLQDGSVKRLGATKSIKVDVRVVAASNLPAQEMLQKNEVRHDLYYRLSGIELSILPLRDRPEDLDVLTDYFIQDACKHVGRKLVSISDHARKLLRNYRWPGNIRQLKSVIEHTLLFLESDYIEARDLPTYLHQGTNVLNQCTQIALTGGSLKDKVQAFERSLVEEALKANHGNLSQAAKALDLPVQTLHSKLKKWKSGI
jgi:arginine utilization regulatory protein